jgi:pimeloyl-ACP methyl ester carboxylesterase
MISTYLQELPHGITLSCRSAGEKGRPVLLFLHGFPEGAFVWDGLLEHFAAPENGGYRCVAPNLRGFERSSAPHDVAAYRAKFLVQDIAALIDVECGVPSIRMAYPVPSPSQGQAERDAGSERPVGEHPPTNSGQSDFMERGGTERSAGPPQASERPLGGQQTPRSGEHGGHIKLACLVAHDWGGAVAWNLAALQPQLLQRLAIINSPHPSTFLRELRHSPAQHAASAYMNFLCRSDAPALLAADDYKRIWPFFTNMGAENGPHAWLTDDVRQQYRDVWRHGLHGGCNYYRASPLRPATPEDPGANAIEFPKSLFTVKLPTLVLWAMDDIALPAGLIDGLDEFVPNMRLERIEGATHWIVHEQPDLVIEHLQGFLQSPER